MACAAVVQLDTFTKNGLGVWILPTSSGVPGSSRLDCRRESHERSLFRLPDPVPRESPPTENTAKRTKVVGYDISET